MLNKFVKLSAPPPGITTDTPSASEARTQKELEKEARLKQLELEKQQARDRVREKEGRGDPNKGLMNKIIEKSGLQGATAEELMIRLQQRSTLIKKLKGQIPEDLIAEYFDQFLFKEQVPETITYDLMEQALKVSRSGAYLGDALDFALYHYAKKRNVDLTKSILNDVVSLQPKMRSVPLMKYLKDAVVGSVQPGFSFVEFGLQNAEDFVIINELMSLALAQPEEDLEELRIQFQKSKDAFVRAREVDDRYKGIFQALLSDEFNRVMTRNVQFVTKMFQLSANNPEFVALRRVLISLKLGETMRDQLFSDLEQKTTAPQSSSKAGSSERFVGSSNKFVRIAQQTPKPATFTPTQPAQPAQTQPAEDTIDPNVKNQIDKFIGQIITSFQQFMPLYVEKTRQTPEQLSLVKADIDRFISSLQQIQREPQITLSKFNELFWGAAEKLSDKYKNPNSVTQLNTPQQQEFARQYVTGDVDLEGKPIQQRASYDTKFLRVAQTTTLAGFAELLKPDSVLDGIIKGFGAATTASGVLSLDPAKALGGFVFTMLYSNHKEKLNSLARLGLNAPVSISTQLEAENAEVNVLTVANAFNQGQRYLELKNAIETITNTIDTMSENLIKSTVANVQTGARDSAEVAYGNPKEIENNYNLYLQALTDGFDVVKVYKTFLTRLVELSSAQNVKMNFLQYQTSLKAAIAEANRIDAEFKKKYIDKASFSKIARQILEQKKMIQELQVILGPLEMYIGQGQSITDLFVMPGGAGEKLRDIINKVKEARDVIYEEMLNMQDYIQRKGLVKTSPQTTTLPTTIPATSTSAPPASAPGKGPTTQPAAFKQLEQVGKDYLKQQVGNVAKKALGPQFAGLLGFASEQNDFVKIASTPQELSDSFTSNFRFSAVTESQVRFDKLNYYRTKINDPKSDKVKLRQYIQGSDTSLNPAERTILKGELDQVEATQNVLGLSNIAGQVIPQSVQQLMRPGTTPQQAVDILSNRPTGGTGVTVAPASEIATPPTPAPPTGPSKPPTPGQTPADTRTPEGRSMERIRATSQSLFNDPNFMIKVDPKEAEDQPNLYLESLKNQWQQLTQQYDKLRGILFNIITKGAPDLGALRGLQTADMNKKFIKIAKEKKIEADQENIDYVGDYYDELYDESKDSPEFGEALKNPQKWRKVPTTKIPEQR